MNEIERLQHLAKEAFDEFFPTGWTIRDVVDAAAERVEFILLEVTDPDAKHTNYGRVQFRVPIVSEFPYEQLKDIVRREFGQLRDELDHPEKYAEERAAYKKALQRIRNQAAGRASGAARRERSTR